MSAPEPFCGLERRRADLRRTDLHGLDYVEVGPDQTVLDVVFVGRAPPKVKRANVRITGGRPVAVTGIRITRGHYPSLDDRMEVRLDRPGDFSTYSLTLVAVDREGLPTDAPMAGFDPVYASVRFGFKALCPTDQDCLVPDDCPPLDRPGPEINYLAKDFGSFRQLILDRLAQTMPAWRESHEADIGIMLVEILAYAGDQLSYFQDAVATEAYLCTARQRISVRRHARLVDYVLHEGCCARAWLTIAVDADISLKLDAIFFCTAFPEAPDFHALQPSDFAKAMPGSFETFEPVLAERDQEIALRLAHNEIEFYTWGDCACCLPEGSTGATLLDAWVDGSGGKRKRALHLAQGDVLILEEVLGPRTGNPADADPSHRQAVRLTKVEPVVDPLYDPDRGGRPVLRVEWCAEDALAFPLCLSAVMPAPDCSCRERISVARGNAVLVDNGAWVGETLGTVPTEASTETCPTDCAPPEVTPTPGRFRPTLQGAPLTFAQDLLSCACVATTLTQDPRQALPRILLLGTTDTAQGKVTTPWRVRPDLLASGPDDPDFVVEMDDDGRAHLRFGDGDHGRQPAAGTEFRALYRVGNGPGGNVGAGTIVYLVFREPYTTAVRLTPRNPLPAVGGIASEPVADVRMLAPNAFRSVLQRAVTAEDYAALAVDDVRRRIERPRYRSAIAPPGAAWDPCLAPFRRVQNVKATLRWTGSWHQAEVAIDPLGREPLDSETLAEMDAYLRPYRRIGHDLAVEGARYVPLDLGLSVCVVPGYLRGDVSGAVRAALVGVAMAGRPRALFDPDRLTFGQGVYVSPIVAAVQSIPGVMEVQVTRLARYVPGTPPPGATRDRVPSDGMLALASFEIARLDADPNRPDNGRLTLSLRGGR